MVKKKVMKMVHIVKNRETKLPLLKFIIVSGAKLGAIFGVFRAFGADNSTLAGIAVAYIVLRLIMRLVVQIVSIVFSVAIFLVLVIIISLVII